MSSYQIVYHKYNMYNAYVYKTTIGIAQLNTFSCANDEVPIIVITCYSLLLALNEAAFLLLMI